MAEILIALIAYNLLFWRKHYADPFRQSTGELLSTYFPHWRWCGRQWAKARIPATDNIYYKHPACIPFLSTFYPPHMLSSLLSVRLSHDAAFTVLAWMGYAHFALGSALWYMVFSHFEYSSIVAIFGAITVTYAAYMIKPQNPCIVFTNAWIPGMLIPGPIGWVSCGMAILGGYWPLLIYFLPIATIVNPSCLFGILIGLPQIIPFSWYWPKSIRSKQWPDQKFGAVPLWRFIDLFLADIARVQIKGVMFTEMSMYVGIVALLFLFTVPSWWPAILTFALLASGFAPFRVAARWLHLFTVCIVFAAVEGFSVLSEKAAIALLFLQAWDLLRNADLQPIHPFCEWVKRPSLHFDPAFWRVLKQKAAGYKVSGMPFPHFTGYIHEIKTLGYSGGFCLKKIAKEKNVDSPLGQGAHSWHDTKEHDNSAMWNQGIRYYFRGNKLYAVEPTHAQT